MFSLLKLSKCKSALPEDHVFPRSGLIERLEYEGYTHQQAVYGVDKAY